MMKGKFYRNEDGLSLAELLAATVITAIIVIFITSIIIFIQKQYDTQHEDVDNLTDIKIALKSITRDVRKADTVEVPNEHTIKITKEEETVTYQLDAKNNILKNGTVYIRDIKVFIVEKVGNKIELIISSGQQQESTTIILRE